MHSIRSRKILFEPFVFQNWQDGGVDSSDSDFSESALCIHSKRYVYRR